MSDFDFNNINDLKTEEKRLYEEYKAKLAEIKKVQKEKEAVGQVFTKGLLPIYVLHILKSGPTNGNEISTKISERTNGLWTPSTGGIYPLLKKLEKEVGIPLTGKANILLTTRIPITPASVTL